MPGPGDPGTGTLKSTPEFALTLLDEKFSLALYFGRCQHGRLRIFLLHSRSVEIYFSQRYFVILRRQEVATKKLLLFILFVGLVLLAP